MSQRLAKAWLRRGPLACALWPLSLIYALIAWLHRGLFSLGLLKTQQLEVPVVVVGNILVGGAGKTPVVMALVDHLKSHGWQPGVISRGYGRTANDCLEVSVDADAALVGDEPLLIQRRCEVPVFVATKRFDAGRALLTKYPKVNIIISDDGLQHHALHHDLSICVFDDRGIGNGWMLPAGPLRNRGCEVTWVLHSGQACPVPVKAALGRFSVKRRLAPNAKRADGSEVALEDLKGRHLHALAGIARPGLFFDMLRRQGLKLTRTTALPDHCDFDSYKSLLDMPEGLICTEKDAVKLWRHVPQALAVPLRIELDGHFLQSFSHAVTLLCRPKL